MIEVAVIVVGVIVLACVIAWFMKRKEVELEPIREARRPELVLRRPRVMQEMLAPLTFVEQEERARKASGIFVVMKSELVEQLAVIAKDKRMSRSGLCRALILRGLEAEVKS